MKYPDSLTHLKECFSRYQGIGDKSAERLALFTILKMNKDTVLEFSDALKEAKEKIHVCPTCGLLMDTDVCSVCSNPAREPKMIIIESTAEAIAFEKIGYSGRYFVLSGLISPLNGVSAQDINLDTCLDVIKKYGIKEVTLALSSSIAGEMTTVYLANLFKEQGIQVYRIGHGLPSGGEIEYADDITLTQALEGQRKL